MKRLLTAFLIICFSAPLLRAASIDGIVSDQKNGEAMPFVTISLLRADSSLIAGATTDDNGRFSLPVPKGQYILQVSYVGYRTTFMSVSEPAANLTVRLQEETEQLAEVVVKTKKQLIERQMDKLVLNVANSPFAAGSNGKELLKKAPGVMVDKDGNITVNGKSVEVYIDGRPSYLSGEQLKSMLEGTDGNTIEKIEIISNPSAKYDASGTGGIINIKTKRNMMKGLNGTLAASAGGMYYKDIRQFLLTEYVSLNLNYRTDKTYTNVQLTQVYGNGDATIHATTETPDWKRYTDMDTRYRFQFYSLRVANDFKINEKNTLGFIVQVPVMKVNQEMPQGASSSYQLNNVGDTTEWADSYTKMPNYAPQHTANLNYTHVFSDSLERELTINADYNRYSTNNTSEQYNAYRYADGSALNNGLIINTRQKVDIYSAKLDFQTRFWQTGMIETGVKYALSNTFNNMTTDSLLDGALLNSTPQDFDYHEHVAAAYITAGKQFGQHISLKLGLRGEYTYSQGDWRTADTTTTKSYFNIFPTMFFSYTTNPLGKLAQPISVGISYTRRIKRPSYNQMNPFKTYIDARNYQMGNTELTPEFNNDVEINFGYSQYLSLTGTFSHTQDMQQMKTEILPNGDGRMMWLNFGTCTTHGFNLSLTELPIVPKFDNDHNLQGAWLALTFSTGYYHFINKSYEKYGSYVNKNHFYRFDGTLNAYLPNDWTISVDANYSAPMTIGYNYQHANYSAGAGVRKMFPKIGLILNLQAQDLFRSMRYVQESADGSLGQGYRTYLDQDMHQQKIMLSVVYMFGTQQWQKQRNVGQLDEAGRLGGSSTPGL